MIHCLGQTGAEPAGGRQPGDRRDVANQVGLTRVVDAVGDQRAVGHAPGVQAGVDVEVLGSRCELEGDGGVREIVAPEDRPGCPGLNQDPGTHTAGLPGSGVLDSAKGRVVDRCEDVALDHRALTRHADAGTDLARTGRWLTAVSGQAPTKREPPEGDVPGLGGDVHQRGLKATGVQDGSLGRRAASIGAIRDERWGRVEGALPGLPTADRQPIEGSFLVVGGNLEGLTSRCGRLEAACGDHDGPAGRRMVDGRLHGQRNASALVPGQVICTVPVGVVRAGLLGDR